MNTHEIAIQDGATTLSLWKKPAEVIAEATEAANALIGVIERKKNKVMFNGEQYIEREDWGTVAKFFGCTAKIIETRYLEFPGGVRGFEAIAVCLDRNLNEISRAESMCLSDEKNWGDVPVYEWQDELDENGKKIWDAKSRNGKGGYKAKKVQVGSEPKPLFQLRSMAQTRSEAKVLKSVFGYVVVLAGYKPYVAEEMTGDEQPREDDVREKKQPVSQPQRASASANLPTEEITGIISGAKKSAKGSLWLHLGDKLAAVGEKLIKDEMVDGNFLHAIVRKKTGAQVGDFWEVVEVKECSAVAEAQVYDVAEESQETSGAEAAPNPGLQGLFDSGAVRSGTSIMDAATKEDGTIGQKRAQRVHIIIRQNEKESGFTENKLAEIKAELGVEHTKDIPLSKWSVLEGYANGSNTAWKE